MPDLLVEGLRVSYGHLPVIQGVDLRVGHGEIVTLIGANGAGKTTLLRTISGLHPATEGRVLYDGAELLRMPAHRRARSGVVLVPEGRRVFPRLTVEENLLLGAWGRREGRGELQRIYDRFPLLAERRRQPALTLSGGEQQVLAVGRALMRDPRVLLLDEPSMGLAPTITATVFELLAEINGSGVTLLLVEQNARMALRIADRGYVLERGSIALEGTAGELLRSDRVRRAYLGEV